MSWLFTTLFRGQENEIAAVVKRLEEVIEENMWLQTQMEDIMARMEILEQARIVQPPIAQPMHHLQPVNEVVVGANLPRNVRFCQRSDELILGILDGPHIKRNCFYVNFQVACEVIAVKHMTMFRQNAFKLLEDDAIVVPEVGPRRCRPLIFLKVAYRRGFENDCSVYMDGSLMERFYMREFMISLSRVAA